MGFGFICHWRNNGRLLQIFLVIQIFCLFISNAGAVENYDSTGHTEQSGVSHVGDEITIGGRTNLSPGTVLLITVEGMAFGPTVKGDGEVSVGTSGTAVVEEGPPSFWSFSFNTSGWTPGFYRITIESPRTGITKSVTFSLLPLQRSVPVSPVPSAEESSLLETEPFPTIPVQQPTVVPLSPVIVIAGCAAVSISRWYLP